MEVVFDKDVPVQYKHTACIVEDEYIPTDRTFRDAWQFDGVDLINKTAISVNIPKAKEIHKERLRWSKNNAQDRRDALESLDRIDMADFARRRIGELSGGQRQRVFIARALVTHPRLLLLDEPTASIDSRGQTEFYQLLKRLNQDVTIVVVSHDLLVISTYVKSVACVNRRLHYHQQAEITGDMLETMYPCTVEEVCPVELVTHGHLPHRVLQHHEE